MFAGGVPSTSDFKINISGSANTTPIRNYFDTKLNASRRSNIKMMASYNVTFITPEGE